MARTALAGYSIGTSHLAAGSRCQDFARLFEDPRGTIYAALSDGMGSGARSEEGSRVAVEIALSQMPGLLPADAVPTDAQVRLAGRAVLDRAREGIQIRANELGCPPAELKCTLLSLTWTSEWLAAISVGDAFLAAREFGASRYEVLVPPDRDEYENMTFSILGSDATSRLSCRLWVRPFSFVCASTDGLLGLALRPHTWEPHAPFFRLVETQVAIEGADAFRVERFLKAPEIIERADDDLSMICIRVHEAAPVPIANCSSEEVVTLPELRPSMNGRA